MSSPKAIPLSFTSYVPTGATSSSVTCSINQSNEPMKKALSSSSSIKHDVLAGAFAGFIGRLITAPFDVLKIRFQLQSTNHAKYTSMIQAFNTLVKEEGLTSLWKGNLSATYLWISYAMVQFGVYGVLKRFGESTQANYDIAEKQEKERRDLNFDKIDEISQKNHLKPFRWSSTFLLFVAGAGAGISATLATYPFDIMRTQFAIQGNIKAYDSMRSFVTHTFQKRGLSGFYAGVVPAVVGITPYMGLNYALYETIKVAVDGPLKALKVSALGNMLSTGFCGAIAGGTSKFLVYPLDTIKKRLQLQVLVNTVEGGATTVRRYDGIIHCAKTILQQEGVAGFYRGIVPTVAKSFVATAATFAAFEVADDFLKRRDKMIQRTKS